MHIVHIIELMQPVPLSATADLVKKSRESLGLSQAAFGALIGKSQGVVSRYEKGEVAPPGDVAMQCMNIFAGVANLRPASKGSLEDLVSVLEGALALARSMRDGYAGLTQSDGNSDNPFPPRQA